MEDQGWPSRRRTSQRNPTGRASSNLRRSHQRTSWAGHAHAQYYQTDDKLPMGFQNNSLIVRKIRDILVNCGFTVWMDETHMSKATFITYFTIPNFLNVSSIKRLHDLLMLSVYEIKNITRILYTHYVFLSQEATWLQWLRPWRNQILSLCSYQKDTKTAEVADQVIHFGILLLSLWSSSKIAYCYNILRLIFECYRKRKTKRLQIAQDDQYHILFQQYFYQLIAANNKVKSHLSIIAHCMVQFNFRM